MLIDYKCELECGAEMSTMLTHCSTPQVAALALQAQKASYARPSHFKVERLALSSWQTKAWDANWKPACHNEHP